MRAWFSDIGPCFKIKSSKSPFSAKRINIKYLVRLWKMLCTCTIWGWFNFTRISISRGRNLRTKSLGAFDVSIILQANELFRSGSLSGLYSPRYTCKKWNNSGNDEKNHLNHLQINSKSHSKFQSELERIWRILKTNLI